MEIKTMKLGIEKISQFKLKTFIIALSFISHYSLLGQTFNEFDEGTYYFDSNYPAWDMHFWLFDDGYHSFAYKPIHQYGNYSIPAIPKLYHAEPYGSNDVDETSLGIIGNGKIDFVPEQIIFQNQVQIKRSWNLVNSEDNFYILMFENNKYDEPLSGCVEFHFNINNIAVLEDEILDDYGNGWVDMQGLDLSNYEGYTHKYVWSYQGLKKNEQRFIYIPAICLAPSMEFVYTRGVIHIEDCDEIFDENNKNDGANEGIINSPYYTLRSVVSNNPHDPNYIESDPTCYGIPANYNSISQTFKYKLVFQNEGEDPAINVVNNFRSNYPIESVLLLDSSFPCLLSWDSNGIHVGFPNIYLRGLNEEEPRPSYEKTIGWIELDVCYSLESSDIVNNCIDFDGFVTFDNEYPIETNNTICYLDGCLETDLDRRECKLTNETQGVNENSILYKISTSINEVKEFRFNLYPNPVNNILRIEMNNCKTETRIFITNILGECVLQESEIDNSIKNIDVTHLDPGVYYVKVIKDGIMKTNKFVKL